MRAWGRLLQLLGCWSVLGATQLLRSSGSRAPPSPGTSAKRGRSPVHACVQVCAIVGLGWQPGGHSSELWVLQRLEQDYDLARGRLGLCCECSGCQPLLCWGKSHLHIAAKSPVFLGRGKWSSTDLACKNGSRCCFDQKSSRGWTGWKRKKSGEREKKTTENPQGSNGAEKKGMESLRSSPSPPRFVALWRIISL